jgi:hypothetical protein
LLNLFVIFLTLFLQHQHQKLKLCKVPPHIEHSSQVKLQWIKLFWKRILKCEKITGEDSQWMQIDDNSSQDPSDKNHWSDLTMIL